MSHRRWPLIGPFPPEAPKRSEPTGRSQAGTSRARASSSPLGARRATRRLSRATRGARHDRVGERPAAQFLLAPSLLGRVAGDHGREEALARGSALSRPVVDPSPAGECGAVDGFASRVACRGRCVRRGVGPASSAGIPNTRELAAFHEATTPERSGVSIPYSQQQIHNGADARPLAGQCALGADPLGHLGQPRHVDSRSAPGSNLVCERGARSRGRSWRRTTLGFRIAVPP